MKELRVFECLWCEETIVATRPWQKFCTHRCRDKYHNTMKRLKKWEDKGEIKHDEDCV